MILAEWSPEGESLEFPEVSVLPDRGGPRLIWICMEYDPYWTLPELDERSHCGNVTGLASPEVVSCYGRGVCNKSTGFCICDNHYGDIVTHCQYSFFHLYSPSVIAVPIVGIILSVVLMGLFILEIMVDVRRKKFLMFKTPLGISKLLMFPYMLNFIVFLENMISADHPSEEIIELIIDMISHGLLFAVVTVLALGWYGMLMSSKRLSKNFPLARSRIVLIVAFCLFIVGYFILCILDGLHILNRKPEYAVAAYIFVLCGIIGYNLIQVSRWLSNKDFKESKKLEKVKKRNNFMIGVLVGLLLDALIIIAKLTVPEFELANIRLLFFVLNEVHYLIIAALIFLFTQNYFIVVGVMRGYFYVSEIPTSHGSATNSTPTGSNIRTKSTATSGSKAMSKKIEKIDTRNSTASSDFSSTMTSTVAVGGDQLMSEGRAESAQTQ